MNLTDRLTVARDLWMSRYLEALVQYRTKYQPGGPEALLQLSDNGDLPAFRLYRIDMASGAVEPPNLTDVNLESVPGFPAEHYMMSSGLKVTIEPFHWNGAELVVRPPLIDIEPIADWCHQWLDVSESNALDEQGLLGAIHSVTKPEVREGVTFFSVDFGTAGIEAVDSLLNRLHSIGATAVHIASSWART